MAPSSERGLLLEERRRRICELLREEGRVTVDSLASRFGISQVTIRADLSLLELAGALTRTHGGAVATPEADQSLNVKQLQHHAEKVRIAEAAAGLICDGETIILDSGTTTAEIARRIRTLDLKSINVITNALNIAALLVDVPAVRLIVPGGILRRESNSLSGPMAEAALGSAAGRPALPRRRRGRSADRRHDSPPGRGRAQRPDDRDRQRGCGGG